MSTQMPENKMSGGERMGGPSGRTSFLLNRARGEAGRKGSGEIYVDCPKNRNHWYWGGGKKKKSLKKW